MKITKPFCIDEELIPKLKNINASDLVTELLKEHFDGENVQNLGKLRENLKKKLQKKAILLKEVRLLKKKIAEITAKEARILKISRKYPDYVFKCIDGCRDVMAFYSMFRTDTTLKRFKWIELKKTFNEVKGGNNKNV